MGNKPPILNREPEEAPEPAKPSELTLKLLDFLCMSKVMGKWQILKDRKASFRKVSFKIEQAFWSNQIDIYVIGKDGKLTRAFSARDVFLQWQIKHEEEFEKFAKELMQKEKAMIEPLEGSKGDFKKVIKIRAAIPDAEKRWLDRRLTPIEQSMFYRKHELWKKKGNRDVM